MKLNKLQEKYYYFQRCVYRLTEGMTRDLSDELILSGMVKHYEMAFELGWKSMRDYMMYLGVSVNPSPRDSIKAAFKQGIEIHSHIWLEMIEFRNKMVHEYGEEAAYALIGKLEYGFLEELQHTVEVMKILLDGLE